MTTRQDTKGVEKYSLSAGCSKRSRCKAARKRGMRRTLSYVATTSDEANGRVEDWRGTRERARLQPPPPQTARTDFPYAASLSASRQGLCDLSRWARVQARHHDNR